VTTQRNPFAFGRVVANETFCNRQRELSEIRDAARTGRSLWLHSPRRYGKTSLILEAFAGTDLPFGYVDVYPAQDKEGLAEAYLRGMSRLLEQVLGPGDRLLRWLRQSMTHVSPQLSIDPMGGVSLTLGPQVAAVGATQLDEIVEIPQRLSASHDIQVTIAIDEFQEVTRFPGLEEQLRSRLQHHDRVTYLFAGSRRSLLADLFSDRKRPFYQFAEHYPLEPIAGRELVRYVRGRFRDTGVDVPAEAADSIVAAACGHPHYTQMLASRVWELARRGDRDPDIVPRALDHLARSQDLSNRRWFESLSASSRRVALHIARYGGQHLFSEAARRRSRLGPASSVQKALVRFTEREDLVREPDGEYRFDDPLLAHWLAGIE
jgi:uncharacterized protein